MGCSFSINGESRSNQNTEHGLPLNYASRIAQGPGDCHTLKVVFNGVFDFYHLEEKVIPGKQGKLLLEHRFRKAWF